MKLCMCAIWVAAGCVAPALGNVEQHDIEPTRCPVGVCGDNSPGHEDHGLERLSQSGQPNKAGFRIVGFTKDGLDYTLDVTRSRLTGTRFGSVLAKQDLVGAKIELDREGSRSWIRIARVGEMEFPVGEPDLIETYVLELSTIGSGGWRNLCANPVLNHVVDVGPDAMGLPSDEVILYEGDQIDLVSKTVSVEPDRDWFSVACSGHVLAKLFLTRNTIASMPAQPNHVASVPGTANQVTHPGRQATLKMIVADYCGTGRAFTVAHQALLWYGGLVQPETPPATMEAWWSQNGAMCLTVPRMITPSTENGAHAFPDVEAAIVTECPRPPPCPQVVETDGWNRVSGNPSGSDPGEILAF